MASSWRRGRGRSEQHIDGRRGRLHYYMRRWDTIALRLTLIYDLDLEIGLVLAMYRALDTKCKVFILTAC